MIRKSGGGNGKERRIAKGYYMKVVESKGKGSLDRLKEEWNVGQLGMAWPGRGSGRGSRGCPRQRNPSGRPMEEPGNQRRGRQSILLVVQAAACAYQEGTDKEIHRIIENMESSVLEEQSKSETEEWEAMVSDPRNMRGRMMLYKQSFHIYSVLKSLLAKALE